MKYRLKQYPTVECEPTINMDWATFRMPGSHALSTMTRAAFLREWEPVPELAPPLVEDELEAMARRHDRCENPAGPDLCPDLLRRAQAELRRLRKETSLVIKARDQWITACRSAENNAIKAAVREGAIAVERDRLKAEVEAQRQDAIGRATRIRELKAEVEALRKERDELEKDLDYIRDMAE